MTTTFRRLTLVLGALALPALASAQQPVGPRGAVRRPMPPAERPDVPRADVTHILNARRQLDLTPRQVAQLDSIERAQFAARRADQERMRAFRDSLRGNITARAREGVSRDSLRAQARARLEAQRPAMEQMRRRDSTARAAAERVLNETQRGQLREMLAERRGFERGLRAGRGERAPQGARRPQGFRGDRGAPRQGFAPRAPDGAPRMRRPDAAPMGPRRAPGAPPQAPARPDSGR